MIFFDYILGRIRKKDEGGEPIPAPVSSVFGRIGAVIAQAGDYSLAQITGLQAALDLKVDKEAVLMSSTQWSTTVPATILPDGAFINLFSRIDNATEKSAAGTTAYDSYDISSNKIVVPYVGKPYENLRILHKIRVNVSIAIGSTQTLRLELRRAVDDSVVGAPMEIYRSQDEPSSQRTFVTYTASASDPFVTGGFYIAVTNNSGSPITLDGSLGIYIENFFQKSVKF